MMNKISFGPPNGPKLDIYGIAGAISLADAESFVTDLSLDQQWGKVNDVLPANLADIAKTDRHKTLVGHVFNHCFVALNYPRGTTSADALREIERYEESLLPPSITAALLAASKVKGISQAPAIFAYYASKAGESSRVKPMIGSEIKSLTKAWINTTLEGEFPDAPINAVDRGLLIIEVGKQLWDEGTAMRCGRHLLESAIDGYVPMSFPIMAALADAYRLLSNDKSISVRGVALKQKDEPEIWLQFIEFMRGDITKQALQFLCRGRWPASNENFIWFDELPDEIRNAPQVDDVPSALAWSRSLIRDAEENKAYIPSGGFVLTFPEDYPLRKWGLPGLRIHADPAGFWVSTQLNRAENLFRWEPAHGGLNPIFIPHELAPLMDITLAALWRDMSVEGETVIRATRKKQKKNSNPSQRTPANKQKTHRFRRRKIIFKGESCEWGSEDEQLLIPRRRHAVNAHFRRLIGDAKASEKARQTALEHGYALLPDGFTFVKSHIRGHCGEVNEKDVVVVAQGLQAATTFLKGK